MIALLAEISTQTTATTHEGSALAGFILIGVAALLYFTPALVARRRHSRNTLAIFVLNLFLGWTLLGWVIALVWAYKLLPRCQRYPG
jgi:uncharacterized membrane protein